MSDSADSIRDKIRKLLRVAECDSASEAERATAIYQASRLSQRHAIDLDSLGAEASDFGETVLQQFPTRQASWCRAVGVVLAEHFNVRCYTCRSVVERGDRVVEWFAFGCRPSREVASFVWVFLSKEFQRLAKEMRPNDRPSFFMSLAIGLVTKLNELKGKEPEPQNMGLIVQKLDDEFAGFSSSFGVMRKPKIDPDREAFLRGKEIEIHTALRTVEPKKIGG